MSDSIPEDVQGWLREAAALDGNYKWTVEDAKQLKAMLRSRLMKCVFSSIAARLEGMKERILFMKMDTPESVAEVKSLQAEAAGIMVVLETFWGMSDADT